LKTLEEPPEHVKFIFCTTEPTKIPITILSRCQRFDFAGILTGSIRRRLEQIVAAEGVEADSEALEVLARRAAGSMRDSQSLLEQLLAFSPGRITLAEVHGMLGTAGDERLAALVGHLVQHDAAAALAEFDAALLAGVDAPQLVEQVFGYFRDCMAAAVGCSSESFLYTSSAGAARVVEDGRQMGLNAVLAAMQILDQALSRMRYSTQGRIIAELAIVQISRLDELDDLSALIAQLQSGATPEDNPRLGPRTGTMAGPAAAKKKLNPPVTSPANDSAAASAATSAQKSTSTVASMPVGSAASAASPVSEPAAPALPEQLTALNAPKIWSAALSRLSGIVVEQAKHFDSIAVVAPNRLVIRFKPQYDFCRSACERPEQVARFEQALSDVTGQRVRIEFAVSDDEAGRPPPVPSAKAVSQHQRLLEVMKHPLLQRAGELFGAGPVRVDDTSSRE
jgi:DNA polymerase-3 subunit gamma/tau